MTIKKKKIEIELIVTNVGLRGDTVILDLSFTKPRPKEPTQQQLEKIIEPIPKSQMEKMGREVAKGYMEVVQKQMQKGIQDLARVLPSPLPPDTIRIPLSKQEYIELGRPAVLDKLTLRLGTKISP